MSRKGMWSAMVLVTGLWAALGGCKSWVQEGHRPQDHMAPVALEQERSPRSPSEKAMDFLEHSLALARQERNREGEVGVLLDLGYASGYWASTSGL